MSKEILVNVGERETRIAVLDDGRLSELHLERGERVVGSLYQARVENVLPGMDAAFVDIGLGRNAFLHVGDLLPTAGSAGRMPQIDADDDEDEDDDALEPSEGGRSRSHRGMRRSHRKQQRIGELLKRGQELLVQVSKGPRGTKGARVSTLISLPGRYLVLMPESDTVGVSRKVEERAERERLRSIGERLHRPGFGIILRTEAEDKAEADLAADHDALMELWTKIQTAAARTKAPALIHRDLTLVSKVIRDIFGSDVSRLVIDDPDEYQKANELLGAASPKLRGRIQLYTGEAPIFAQCDVEQEIERSLRRKVWLRSGGHLIFDVTEALTVVDVNTGKFTGGSSLADTILKTNTEAATEIARQLRLRDIGGIIVIDFIDMATSKDRQQVLGALEAALRKDKARTKISNISPLGLVEMTRKRTSETIADFMSEPCTYCGGRGSLPSAETISLGIEREVFAHARAHQRHDALHVTCHPDVAELLVGEDGANIDRIEQEVRKAVYVRSQLDAPPDRYDVSPGQVVDIERKLPGLRRDQVVDCRIMPSRLQPDAGAVGWADGLLVQLADGRRAVGQQARVRLTMVRRSWAEGILVGSEGTRTVDRPR